MATPQTPKKEDIILPRDSPRARAGTTPRIAAIRAPTRNLSSSGARVALEGESHVPRRAAAGSGRTPPVYSTRPSPNHMAGPPSPYHDQSLARYKDDDRRRDGVDRIGLNRMRVSESIIVETAYGVHSLPNYDNWPEDRINIEYNSVALKLAQLRKDWSHIPGLNIEGPREGENIVNLVVRYREYEQFVLSHNGSDFWFMALVAGWSFIEWAASEFGFPVDGFVLSQIKMYPVYQASTKKMGKGGAFGEGWSPLMQVGVISMLNAALLAVVSKLCPQAKDYAPMVMNELAKSICGGETNVKYSELGTPQPSKEKSLPEKIGSMIPADAIGMMKGMGGIKGLINMGMAYMNMGGGDKKESKSERKRNKQKREEGPSESF